MPVQVELSLPDGVYLEFTQPMTQYNKLVIQGNMAVKKVQPPGLATFLPGTYSISLPTIGPVAGAAAANTDNNGYSTITALIAAEATDTVTLTANTIFVVNQPILMPTGKTLRALDGTSVTIKRANNYTGNLISFAGCDSSTLTNISIDGNFANNTASEGIATAAGVLVNGGSNNIISHCRFFNHPAIGVYAFESLNCTIQYNLFNDCFQSVYINGGFVAQCGSITGNTFTNATLKSRQALEITSSNSPQIFHNTFSGAGTVQPTHPETDGTWGASIYIWNTQFAHIENNTCNQSYWASLTFNQGATDIVATHNYFSKGTRATTSGANAVIFDGANSNNLNLSFNIMDGSFAAGASGGNQVTFANNTVNSTQSGIYSQASNRIIFIQNNTINRVSGTNNSGILLTDKTSLAGNVLITNNTLVGFTNGITVSNATNAGSVFNINAHDNTFTSITKNYNIVGNITLNASVILEGLIVAAPTPPPTTAPPTPPPTNTPIPTTAPPTTPPATTPPPTTAPPATQTPAPTPPPVVESGDDTSIPPFAKIIDASLNTWTLASGVVSKNGVVSISSNIILLYYLSHSLYAESSALAWFKWSGTAWVASTDPRPVVTPVPTTTPVPTITPVPTTPPPTTPPPTTPPPTTAPPATTPPPTTAPPLVESLQGTTIPSFTLIVDQGLHRWVVTAGVVYRDSVATISSNVQLLLYWGHLVYQQNQAGNWWYWDNAVGGGLNPWTPTVDPRVATTSSTTLWGLNAHHGVDVNTNTTWASVFSARNMKVIRLDISSGSTGSVNRDLCTKIIANGGKVQGIVKISYSDDHTIYTGVAALSAVEQNAYSQTYAIVGTMMDVIQDWEFLNEITLRSECMAQADPNNASAINESFFTGKTAYISIGNVLHGMSRALTQRRIESGRNLRAILGTNSRGWGFLRYMQTLGVSFDMVGWHNYLFDGSSTMLTDTFYGTGGPLVQMAAFGKPVTINELNAAEIYDGSYVNTTGSTLAEAGYRGMGHHGLDLRNQTKCTLDSVVFYEFLDEGFAGPEGRFGLWFNSSSPKIVAYVATALAGGTLTTAERQALISRGIYTDAQISAMQPGGVGTPVGVPAITAIPHRWDMLQVGNAATGGYWVNDNPWGNDYPPGGAAYRIPYGTYTETIGRNTTLGPNGEVNARFTWSFPQTYNGTNTDPNISSYSLFSEVKAYPCIIYGARPGYMGEDIWPTWEYAVRLPDNNDNFTLAQVQALGAPSNITGDWHVQGGSVATIKPCGDTPGNNLPQSLPLTAGRVKAYGRWNKNTTPTGKGHIVFDMWVQNTATQNHGLSSERTNEIMVVLEGWGGYPRNTSHPWYVGNSTIGGIVYYVFHTGYGVFGAWDGHIYQASTGGATGLHPLDANGRFQLDISGIVNDVYNRGYITAGTKYLVDVELGVEMIWGNGDVTIYDYKVSS